MSDSAEFRPPDGMDPRMLQQRIVAAENAADSLLSNEHNPVLVALAADIDPEVNAVFKQMIKQARWEKAKKLALPVVAAVGLCVSVVLLTDSAAGWVDSMSKQISQTFHPSIHKG